MDLKWRKSSHSGPDNNCVEVAFCQVQVHVRDSKDSTLAGHVYSRASWHAFVRAMCR